MSITSTFSCGTLDSACPASRHLNAGREQYLSNPFQRLILDNDTPGLTSEATINKTSFVRTNVAAATSATPIKAPKIGLRLVSNSPKSKGSPYGKKRVTKATGILDKESEAREAELFKQWSDTPSPAWFRKPIDFAEARHEESIDDIIKSMNTHLDIRRKTTPGPLLPPVEEIWSSDRPAHNTFFIENGFGSYDRWESSEETLLPKWTNKISPVSIEEFTFNDTNR